MTTGASYGHAYRAAGTDTTVLRWTSWTCTCVHCTPKACPDQDECLGGVCTHTHGGSQTRTATISGSVEGTFQGGVTWDKCSVTAGYTEKVSGSWEKTQTFTATSTDTVLAGQCAQIAARFKDEYHIYNETMRTHTFWSDGHCPVSGHAGTLHRQKKEWASVTPATSVVGCTWAYCNATKPEQRSTTALPAYGTNLDGNGNPCP